MPFLIAENFIGVSAPAGTPDAVVSRLHAAIQEAPVVPFLDVVTYRFGISDPEQHFHLPFKCTPWGYSCFRGGA